MSYNYGVETQQPTTEQPSLFGDAWGWLNKMLANPNVQSGLAQMAAAINPGGPGGRVGKMFGDYIQGVQAQDAFTKRMTANQDFMKAIAGLLGGKSSEQLGPTKGMALFNQAMSDADTSSKNWMNQNVYGSTYGSVR